jgi:putative metallohydrolase (TIGR04338 family)
MLAAEKDQSHLAYSAESFVEESSLGQQYSSLDEACEWVQTILDTRWFASRFPHVRQIILHDGRGCQRAACWRDRDGLYHIALPRWYRCQLRILHELAHAAGSLSHDREFCRSFLLLVRRFISTPAREDLKMQFMLEGVLYRRFPCRDPPLNDPWAFIF